MFSNSTGVISNNKELRELKKKEREKLKKELRKSKNVMSMVSGQSGIKGRMNIRIQSQSYYKNEQNILTLFLSKHGVNVM